MYFDQQTHTCAYIRMVKNDEKHKFLSFSTMQTHTQACIRWSKYTTGVLRHCFKKDQVKGGSLRGGLIELYRQSNGDMISSSDHCLLNKIPSVVDFCIQNVGTVIVFHKYG